MTRRTYEVKWERRSYHALEIVNDQPIPTSIRTPSIWRMKEALEKTHPDLKIASQRKNGAKWLITLEGEDDE